LYKYVNLLNNIDKVVGREFVNLFIAKVEALSASNEICYYLNVISCNFPKVVCKYNNEHENAVYATIKALCYKVRDTFVSHSAVNDEDVMTQPSTPVYDEPHEDNPKSYNFKSNLFN
jgi:hypothetical protein